MPAEGADRTVNVTSSTLGFEVGEPVWVQNWGTMLVVNVAATSLTLRNLENTATGAYPQNAAPGTSLAATSKIVPTGFQGPAGTNPATALLSANNLSDVANAPTSRSNLGLGTAAVADTGVGLGDIPLITDAAGLTNGEFLQANASGIISVDDATARSDMGLGTMATQNAGAVAITGGALNGTLGATTPSSVAATSITASGAVSSAGNLTASAGVFTPSGAVQTLAAGNAVSPNAGKVRVAGSGGAVIITATPSITNPGVDGQRLLIMGTSDANTVELQDISTLGGSNLNLAGNANVVLGAGDILDLIWDSTVPGWFEVSRSLN